MFPFSLQSSAALKLAGQLRPAAIPSPKLVGKPADIVELQRPEFWPEGLDSMDNQRVSQWLLGHGEWQGQEPGWEHYALDSETAAMKPGTWSWRNKRAMDVTLTLLGLPFVLPIMALAVVALKISAPREPILFKQWRPGYLCKPFQIFKFRTMRSAGDSESPREDGFRLTRLGRFLRNASIDELPQLFNVLKGEMSLVGPRPHLLPYLPRFLAHQLQRHQVLPGLTGMAQTKGRNILSNNNRYMLDLLYVEKRKVILDLRLLALTIPKVLLRQNVNRNGSGTYSELLVR